MGQRHKAREFALHGLYMFDTVSAPIERILSLDWVEEEVTDDEKEFFAEITKGTIAHIAQIDDLIRKHSKNWSFERISAVDKSILRLSVYAMLYDKEVSPVISINEGIELGKKFGGENSGHFINGILDAINKHELSVKSGGGAK
jgi:N utilization substance protein B